MFFKKNICEYAKYKKIKFSRGNYQPIVQDTNALLSLLFKTKFSSASQFKHQIELFSTFFAENGES